MDSLTVILPLLVFIVLLWFTYLNIYYLYFIIKQRNKDHTLKLCLNTVGKIFYIFLLITYVVGMVGSIVYMCLHIQDTIIYTILNIVTVYSIVCALFFQQVVFCGNKQMLVGRVLLDYRKIKKVNYPKASKMQFTYGQKTYSTSIRFCDDSLLKRAMSKTR